MSLIRYGWDTADARLYALRIFFRWELWCAEFADDGHACACADAVGSGIDHGIGLGRDANSARSFYAGLVAHNAPHERNVFRGGGAEEARGGLDEISLGGQAELSAQDFFFQRQERSLKDHFNNRAAAVRNFCHSDDVIQHAMAIT